MRTEQRVFVIVRYGTASVDDENDRLQLIEFFNCKPCLRYQFAEQAGAEFVMLGDG
jgi:hypothetical protein